MIIDKKELEKTLREGGDPDVIKETFLATLDTISNKIKQENKTDNVKDMPASAHKEASKQTTEPNHDVETNIKPDKTSTESKESNTEQARKPLSEYDANDFWSELLKQAIEESEQKEQKKEIERETPASSFDKPLEDNKHNNPNFWELFENSIIEKYKKEQEEQEKRKKGERQPLKSEQSDPDNDLTKAGTSAQDDSETISVYDALKLNKKFLSELLNSLKEEIQNTNNIKTEPACEDIQPTTNEDSDSIENVLNKITQSIVDYYDSHSNQPKQKKKERAGTGYVTDKATPPAIKLTIDPWDYFNPFFLSSPFYRRRF